MASDPTPSRDPLSPDDVERRLRDLPDWSGDAGSIERVVEAPTFPAAIAVVDAVALVAEDLDHHPDIDIRWRKVRLVLSTHSSGGVTETDLTAASRIDAAVAGTLGSTPA